MGPHPESAAGVAFGRFQVLPHRRELLADGKPLKLGGRAFDVLMALIDARGSVISKDALLARVWPGRVMEENSLQAQVSELRTALGAERELVRTVSGRGYQLTADIHVLEAIPDGHAGMAATGPRETLPPTNLPEPISELIGRDDELHEIVALAARRRLVTLTGAGGMGKTRLALAAAWQLRPRFADGVWLAQLAPLSNAELVSSAVGATAGVELWDGSASPDRVAHALRRKQLLLVLDNCEHVIGAAAIMAEALLRANPVAHVIATSREKLNAEGEWVYPVPPLAVPAGDAEEDDPLGYGAVRLFLNRARAVQPYFTPDRRVAAVIAAICRQLDGIPLAIELAAAPAAALGIDGLAARLDDRLQLLTGGRRTALPRHQTLRATLDWSYGLLDEPERALLRRLAVFAGIFSLEAACAVAAGPEGGRAEPVEGLVNLVAKSLVSAEVNDAIAAYRLLDTTRAYALEKLRESGEVAVVAPRHAEFYRSLFEQAEAGLNTRPASDWLSEYGRHIDNVRAALDWALSPDGDAAIGVALTAAAVPLWMHLSLLEECGDRVKQALARLDAGTSRDARREMKLHAALGASLNYGKSETSARAGAAWAKALHIAENLDDADYQLRSLWGVWIFRIVNTQYPVALQLAHRFHTLAANRSDAADRLLGERLIGVSQHYLGDQAAARHHLEHVFANDAAAGRPHLTRFQIDAGVAARTVLARVLWLQGVPDQAMRAAQASIDDARATGHAGSLCFALAMGACDIALLVGDLATAERYVRMLLEHSTRHALPHWRAFGTCHDGALAIKRGDLTTGVRLLRAGFDHFADRRPLMRFLALLPTEALSRARQVSERFVALEEAIERPEQTKEFWLISDLLRVKGELLLAQGTERAATEAEGQFRQALAWARRQGAPSMELRVATSLARLLRNQDRSAAAAALLTPIYDRFTEGFETADLTAAKALLDGLGT